MRVETSSEKDSQALFGFAFTHILFRATETRDGAALNAAQAVERLACE